MRTYYRGSDALVTDDYFIWRATANRIFAIRELRDIGIARGPLDGSAQTPALAIGAGLLLLAGTSWTLMGPAVGYTATAAAIVATLAVLSLTARRAARPWQLLGTYRGAVVTIYSSPDVRVFNQVARALRRSIENAAPAPGRKDLATA